MTTHFNLRNPKESQTAIHFVCRWNGERLVYHTGYRIESAFWDNKKERAKQTNAYPAGVRINNNLNAFLKGAINVYHTFVDLHGIEPTREQMKQELDLFTDRVQKRKITLFTVAEELIDLKTQELKLKGKDLKRNSIVNVYRQTSSLLQEFASAKRYNLDFHNINESFYTSFLNYMQIDKGYMVNNIGKHFKTLKTFMAYGLKKGYHDSRQFKSFKVLQEETDVIYLNEQELNALFRYDLSSKPNYQKARDLFIVGCWTGLRYSDLSRLRDKHIMDNKIVIDNLKTGGNRVAIPIHPTVQIVLDRYNGFPKPFADAVVNRMIKEVAKDVDDLKVPVEVSKTVYIQDGKGVATSAKKITKVPKHRLITTHTARRSFATNLYLRVNQLDITVYDIMQVTGHKTEKAFLRYIRVTPDESANRIANIWSSQPSKLSVLR